MGSLLRLEFAHRFNQTTETRQIIMAQLQVGQMYFDIKDPPFGGDALGMEQRSAERARNHMPSDVYTGDRAYRVISLFWFVAVDGKTIYKQQWQALDRYHLRTPERHHADLHQRMGAHSGKSGGPRNTLQPKPVKTYGRLKARA